MHKLLLPVSFINDDAAFDAVWQEGRAMSLEQAVALAQQETTQSHD